MNNNSIDQVGLIAAINGNRLRGNQEMLTESANSSSSSNGPRLLDRLRGAIRRLHYSRRTEEAYIHWTKRFICFHGKRHPSELGELAVTAFLNHLATDR